jgi:mono/diheme cytochrome c family protein
MGVSMRKSLGAAVLMSISEYSAQQLSQAMAGEAPQVARGRYLVQFGGCNDCHTPGYLGGRPDPARFLGGPDVGFEIPGLGIFVRPNLTPDKETGLGNWTKEQMITAIQTGVRPDGRILASVMPWRAVAGLTRSDAASIVEYLRQLPPVENKVLGPFGVGEKVTVPHLSVTPPDTATPN